jgi:hypothetical protein
VSPRRHRVYRGELDWWDCQYGDFGFALESIEEILAVWQMVGIDDLKSGERLAHVGRAEQRQACSDMREVVSGPISNSAAPGEAERRRPQLGQPVVGGGENLGRALPRERRQRRLLWRHQLRSTPKATASGRGGAVRMFRLASFRGP